MKILALGNEFRGDDALGVLAARKIKSLRPELEVLLLGDSAKIINYFAEGERIILLDCLRGRGKNPSEQETAILRIDLLVGDLQGMNFTLSSHGFDLPSLLELSQNLGITPASLVLFGLKGFNFSLGSKLSSAVEEKLAELCHQVIQEAEGDKNA